jgi:GNAT superfamily N-acetyltransferase
MIRAATPADEPALLEMGRAFNEEAGYAESVPFDEVSFKLTLGALGAADLLFVVERDGRVIGMAAADVGPSICNRAVKIGREAFWYVQPEHRKGVGKKLLHALECAAKNHGATFFDVVAEVGKRDLALARIYEAAGFSPAERTFRKRLA